MELEEFYKQVGGNFEDVKRRLLNEEFIRKFVLKFKDDETFDNLIDAFNKADYKEAQLEKIYFAGLETYEEDMLMSTISSNLSIETSRFKPTNYTCSKDNNFPIHKYLFVGSLWRR